MRHPYSRYSKNSRPRLLKFTSHGLVKDERISILALVVRSHPVWIATVNLPQAILCVDMRKYSCGTFHHNTPGTIFEISHRQSIEWRKILLVNVRRTPKVVGYCQCRVSGGKVGIDRCHCSLRKFPYHTMFFQLALGLGLLLLSQFRPRGRRSENHNSRH